MSSKDKISKSAWNLIESAKDATSNNIITAIRTGKLKVDSSTVEALLAVVNASIDEGFHKGHKTFMKTVDAELTASAKEWQPFEEQITKKNG